MKIKVHCPFLGHTGYNAHSRGLITALSDLVDLRVDNYTWCDDHHNYLTEPQKNIISEITLKDPNGRERQHPPEWKDKIEDFEGDIDLVLHTHNHKVFWREYTKPKIAYIIWETEAIGDNFFNRMLEYDELWVPSKWQKECAIEQGYPAKKIQIVPSGVEADCMPGQDVKPDDSIFTFCLVGRWDHRKSTTEILKCFVELFGNNPKVQLLASIDNVYALDGLSTQERWAKMGMKEVSNVIFKSFLPRKEYIELLQSSHVFLSCARGEGWNIPLIEAMACGTPSIYSDCSGQTQFARGKGIPIRILGKEPATRVGGEEVSSLSTNDLPGCFFTPDFGHLKKKMQYCIDNYYTLKKKALKDSTSIRFEYTWDHAARIAQSHLRSLYAQTGNPKPSRITDLPPLPKQSNSKVLFPLITYGGMCHTEFAMGVLGTVLEVQRKKGIDMIISPIVFESLISRARNASAAWALSSDYTHLLFVDSDIVFKAEDVFKLLEANKDVAVGLYGKKYYSRHKMEALAKHSPNVFNKEEDWRSLATDFSTEFNKESFEKAKLGQIFEVDYAATGFMLIRTDVFRHIIDKRPDLKYSNDVDGYMSADKDNFYDFFTVGVNPVSKKYESEDYGFCQLWRSLGGKIHVLPDIKLSHTGRNHYPTDMVGQSRLFIAK